MTSDPPVNSASARPVGVLGHIWSWLHAAHLFYELLGLVTLVGCGIDSLMLPQIARHPLSLLRCPSGIDKQCFFRGTLARVWAPTLKRSSSRTKAKPLCIFIKDEKGLLEIVQMGGIELHPWGAPVDAIDYPDRMIFDLDPAPEVAFEALQRAALDLRQRLQHRGLNSTLNAREAKDCTSPFHLPARTRWAAVKVFARSLAEEMLAATPDAYIATMSKAKRTGKIFLDYFRNDYTATAIADYGVRARPGAPVALPIEWRELKNLQSADQFTIKDVLKRAKSKRATPPVPRQTLPAEK